MGVRAETAFLAFGLLLCIAGPAAADALYTRGPVVCRADQPAVKKLTVDGCEWSRTEDDGFYTGTCKGRLQVGSQAIPFSAHGEARRIDYTYPDNDTPLTFSYGGLTCTVESPRLKAVRNCRTRSNGLAKSCEICVITADKVCFDVTVDISVPSTRASAIAK
jgi:hypothetical protein